LYWKGIWLPGWNQKLLKQNWAKDFSFWKRFVGWNAKLLFFGSEIVTLFWKETGFQTVSQIAFEIKSSWEEILNYFSFETGEIFKMFRNHFLWIEMILLKRDFLNNGGRAILKMHLVGSQKQFGKDMMHQIRILTLVSRGSLIQS
jgi:hypothetical protein